VPWFPEGVKWEVSWRRPSCPGSVVELALAVLIALRLTGVVHWSWWWVLSPLWIGGLLVALITGAALAVHLRSRRNG
jgi:hypothetical protein